jgi:glucokinase
MNEIRKAIGIDIGGTSVKTGIVYTSGKIEDSRSISTSELIIGKGIIPNLIDFISQSVISNDIKNIGIVVPGIISRDGRSTVEIPNVPQLKNYPVLDNLEKNMPGISFRLDNDAKAAALGAYCFDKEINNSTFGFITIGTGIGCAALINGKIFRGGNGNGLELGYLLTDGNEYIENLIGRDGLCRLSGLPEELSAKDPEDLVSRAKDSDKASLAAFEKAGHLLGIALFNFIVLLDITTIYIGGGIAPALDFMLPGVFSVFDRMLPDYYKERIEIRKTVLGNNAGIMGAASLCFAENSLGNE